MGNVGGDPRTAFSHPFPDVPERDCEMYIIIVNK